MTAGSASASGSLPHIELYTDGACSRNPGPGGWAYVLRHVASKKEKEGSGGEPESTNNRMELQAVIEGLTALKRPCQVDLYLDSEYVRQGMETWMDGWKKRSWKKKDGKPVINDDLWKKLDQLMVPHKFRYIHVAGHSGHTENDRCDELAVAAYQQYLRR